MGDRIVEIQQRSFGAGSEPSGETVYRTLSTSPAPVVTETNDLPVNHSRLCAGRRDWQHRHPRPVAQETRQRGQLALPSTGFQHRIRQIELGAIMRVRASRRRQLRCEAASMKSSIVMYRCLHQRGPNEAPREVSSVLVKSSAVLHQDSSALVR
ncbi:hypothetical protein BV25DRAFT_1002316 [Artomyces pyxidatus]|uniref:Uncharacterized protein n=1 Tax=Artomyces pyxidatus TaxID=48021 RepID=A0ACB8SV31_9AGAM|nr:hypothetical protein BV25DRAFT_1002316 [Artomyces pyxidatus]